MYINVLSLSKMSSHSVASVLISATHDTILIFGNEPDNDYDVTIRFHSAKVHFYEH